MTHVIVIVMRPKLMFSNSAVILLKLVCCLSECKYMNNLSTAKIIASATISALVNSVDTKATR